MSDDSKELSRVEDILSGEDYIPTNPMSRIEKLLLEGGGPGGKLPEVTSDDNGKILKVKDGAWDKGEDISGDKLPQVSSQDNGKVLKVVQGEWNIDKDEGDRLPVVNSSDNGKILTVKNGGWDKADRVKDAFYYSVIISLEDEVVLPTGFGYKLAEAEPKPVYLYNDSTNRLFSPIEIGRTVSDVKDYAKWQCVYTQGNRTYIETIEYNCTSGTDPLVESSTYSKEEITDEKVKQTPTNDGVYDILLSGSTAGSAEATEGAKKSSTYPLKYSTHGNILMVGDSDSSSGGVDIGWAGVPSIGVGKTNTTTGAKNWVRVGLDDISFNANSSGTPETWDGINTSLKAALAAAAEVGGCEAVYLPLADYEELTTAEKEDPTKIYFVINEGTKVSPTLEADDGNVAASSAYNGYYAWKAFSGSSRTDVKSWEYAWQPWGLNNGEWISYTFSTTQLFSKVSVRIATIKANTMNYYVEGSNDGTNWINLILNGADHISVFQPAQVDQSSFNYITTEILLDTTKGRFSKIRFRTDSSIGYPYSYDAFIVANFDIYASAASNKPSIYYKNVLYTLDELPATTVSDAGKALIVNSDGIWDKGDVPRTNSVQVPPVIFDDNGLKKIDDFSVFPGIEKVYLTQLAYNALTTAQKQDLSKIYYISDYEFYPSDDGKVVIRFNDDGTEKLIFFNGFVDDFNTVTPYSNFPEELRTIVTNNATWGSSATILSTNYDSSGVIRSGNEQYFGIRTLQDWHVNSCNSSGSSYAAKNKANYAILDMLDNSTYQQSESWSDPYDIPYGYDAIYYGGKEYEDFDIPKELPYVTSSDAGKVLKVNSQGIWDKGDVPIPDVNAVQVPPVIFDNGSLKKINDVSGFPGLEKVYLSAEEYDALSTDEKNELSKIYYISQYKYFSNSDNTMIVRRDANSDVWIFFNGWVYDPSAETNLPAGAEVYATEVGNSYGYSDPASQNRPVQNQPCWVRFNGTKASAEFASEFQIRNGKWYPDDAGIYTSPVYGKLKIGENVGSYAYSDPFDTGETISIYYGGKQYTEYEPAKPYVELTQSEYDALPSSKNSDGIMHFITDAGKIILNGIQYG